MSVQQRHCQPGAVVDDEAIPRELEMAETAMVELRLVEGLRLRAFARRFHTDFQTVFGARLGEVWSAGLLEVEGDMLRLTDRGASLATRSSRVCCRTSALS